MHMKTTKKKPFLFELHPSGLNRGQRRWYMFAKRRKTKPLKPVRSFIVHRGVQKKVGLLEGIKNIFKK